MLGDTLARTPRMVPLLVGLGGGVLLGVLPGGLASVPFALAVMCGLAKSGSP